MALKNVALTINFLAWDTGNNVGKTGDNGNFTMRIIKDGGAPAAPTNAVTEPDSTNVPGIYELALTATDMNADFVCVGGKSSTSNIVIFPVMVHTEGGNLNTTVSSRAPEAGGNLATLIARLTAARAAYLDNISAGAAALEATLTAMKGAGWSTETLKAIYDAVDEAIKKAIFDLS